MKIISWNVAHRSQCWKRLLEMDADVALLQEAAEPPPEIAERLDVNPAPWHTAGGDSARRAWRTAVVKLTDRVQVEWIEAKGIDDAGGELAVSRLGVCAVGRFSARSATTCRGYEHHDPLHIGVCFFCGADS